MPATTHGSRQRLIQVLLVVCALGVAAFLRLHRLYDVPLGIDLDEARDGLETARILAGEHPLMFTTFDPREPALFYSSAPFMAVLGRTLLALRLPAVAWGLVGVAMTYALGRQWFGRWTAALAAAGLGASFWHVVESRWAIHSITLPAAVLLFLFLFWRAFACGSVTSFALAGLALGGSVYAHEGARVLPLLVALLLAAQWLLDRTSVISNRKGILLCGCVAVASALPLALYFLIHRDVLFARMGEVSVFNAPLPGIEPITPVQAIVRTLGMFFISGDVSWHKNIPYQPVFTWWLAIPFCVGIVWSLCYALRPAGAVRTALREAPGRAANIRLYPALWLLLAALVMLVPGFFSRPAPHFSRTVGAAPFVYLLLAIGLRYAACRIALLLGRWQGAAHAAAWVLLGVLALNTFRSYFGFWANNDGTQRDFELGQFQAATFLNHEPADPSSTVFFLGSASGASIRYLAPQFDGSVWMEDFSQLVPLPLTSGGTPATYVFAAPSLPESSASPSILQTYFPDAQTVEAGAFANGQPASRIYRITQPQIEAFLGAQRSLGATFGGQVALESANAGSEMVVRAGDQLRLGLAWRILQTSSLNYAAFIHVVDGSGKLVAQDDRQGMAAFGWQAGQRFLSLHQLSLPQATPPGRYRVLAGIDRRSTEGQPSRSLGEIGEQAEVLTLVVLGP